MREDAIKKIMGLQYSQKKGSFKLVCSSAMKENKATLIDNNSIEIQNMKEKLRDSISLTVKICHSNLKWHPPKKTKPIEWNH